MRPVSGASVRRSPIAKTTISGASAVSKKRYIKCDTGVHNCHEENRDEAIPEQILLFRTRLRHPLLPLANRRGTRRSREPRLVHHHDALDLVGPGERWRRPG